MSNARDQWLLKVIAGPHQGAEIGLHAGKTLIGSDGECDVVLHDVLIAPQHLELELSSSGIMAAPLGGRVFVDGKRIRESRQAVASFAFVSIGGSHLVIGPASGKWPLLSAADLPELEKEVETPAEGETAAGASGQATPPGTDGGSPSGPTPIVVRAPVAGAETLAASPRGSRLGPALGITAGLLLLVAWGMIYSNFSGSRRGADDADKLAEKPLIRARTLIEELGLVGSIVVEETAGRLSAEGYVDTETRQRELQAALRAAVPGIRTRIFSLEKIASSARTLVENQRLPLAVASLADGKVKVTGKMESADPWVRMRQTLLREVPGISGIEDEVEIEAQLPMPQKTVFVPVPTVMLSNNSSAPRGNTPAPAAGPKSAVPATTGRPAPAAAAASRPASGVSAPVAASSAPVSAAAPAPSQPSPANPQPDPVTDFLVTPDTIDTPDATIAAIRVSGDGLDFVRLSTGGVYFAGARLPYGGTVMRIEADTVTVIEKGEIRKLRQGSPAMRNKASPFAP